MKIRSHVLSVFAAACLVSPGWLTTASAQVSQDDFNALKKLVEELNQKLNKLEQSHDQDAKQHQQDQQQIQDLKQQLGQTQKTATEAQQKAEAASQVQPVHAIPGEGNATHNFAMVGDAEFQFGKVQGQNSGFVMADFAPIFLYRGGDNVLFEAGFDFILGNQVGTTVNLSFATIDYLINDYVTLVAGNMLLPLGTYSERSAGWLNKFPDAPLARDFVPGNGIGAQLRGAIPVGETGQHFTYSVYGANGPSSIDGSGTSTNLDLGNNNVGLDSSGNFVGNLHSNPSGGARVGWFFPLKPHYDIELGLSGQSGEWDNAGNRLWSAGVLDFAIHAGPYVEVKGEYIHSWQETDDRGTLNPRGWWIQGGYKLAGLNLDLPLINNVELVGRYDETDDDLGTSSERYSIGYVYYLTNTLWFEGDYEIVHSRGPAALPGDVLVFQLSYGF